MAMFEAKLPIELIGKFQELENNTDKMFGEMTQAGAKAVHGNVINNMRKVFKSTVRLEKCLKMTRYYYTPSDDAINTKVAFYGYLEGSEGKKLSYSNKKKGGGRSRVYEYNRGTPAPLVAMAREYGTSMGEAKKPFFRPSFVKSQIQNEMEKTQSKYLPKE